MRNGLSVRRAAEVLLRQLDPSFAAHSIDWLSMGGQATLFLARRPFAAGADSESPHEVVVKIYHTTGRQPLSAIQAAASREFESLQHLHKTLHGRLLDGWEVHTPQPLHYSDEPCGLVMSRVSGIPLSEGLGRLSMAALESLVSTAVRALEVFWKRGYLYGDINFDNILHDVPGQTLAFVDPGAPRSDYACESASRRWYPASRDLAYIVFQEMAAVKKYLPYPRMRSRQIRLVRQLLEAHLSRIDPSEREPLVEEIHDCASLHLRRIAVSASPAGVWRILVRWTASRRIRNILDEVRRPPNAVGCHKLT